MKDKSKIVDRLLTIAAIVCLAYIAVVIILGMCGVMDVTLRTGNPINDYYLNKLLFGK